MAIHTDKEVSELRERAERAEAELAAVQTDGRARSGNEAVERGQKDPTPVEGEAELRKDPTMAHLLDSLAAGKDIGHYGRLVFAMVARHFMTHEEVLDWLMRDSDFSEPKARAMLTQVEARGYNPPKRERIMQWQQEQDFPILPHPEDPDCGNLYRSLKFPDTVYEHIEEYQEQRSEAKS